MEEKKYEAGRVEISSAEYRDLVTDMVEAQKEASETRSRFWNMESERNKLSKELESANKRIAELERILDSLQGSLQVGAITTPNVSPSTSPFKPWWSEFTCSNTKEEN